MKISDLAGSPLTAWIVALATVGALSFMPTRPGATDGHVARPPLADLSIVTPALRSARTQGMDDMAYHDDEPYFEDRRLRGAGPQVEPES